MDPWMKDGLGEWAALRSLVYCYPNNRVFSFCIHIKQVVIIKRTMIR